MDRIEVPSNKYNFTLLDAISISSDSTDFPKLESIKAQISAYEVNGAIGSIVGNAIFC